ncbi:MAG: prephenate dehydrogenase/arogenate dehydrogenase family protein, partial [Deferribacteraceae bacterium]|nr:prephenate dehydrogenase/arogenate dehydrogenase family protein [Deferribacteraceae bacterium]
LYKKLICLGYTVYPIDKAEIAKAEYIFKKSEVILLSVPIGALKEVLALIAGCLDKDKHILADITSVKVFPMDYMEDVFTGSVVGTHPLFGPEPDPADMKVVIVPGKNASEYACKKIEQLYTQMGCRIFHSSAKEHDYSVGISQSLNFAVSAAFFSLLARKEGIRPFLTPSFKRHLQAAKKHLTEDKDMFCEFTAENPEFNRVLKEYSETIDEILRNGLKKTSEEAAIWYKRL